MPAGFMIPARHVPPLMARHTKAGYTTSSGLSLAQPNMAEGQFDMSQTADSEIAKIREEEFESKSGSDNIEGASGEDQDGERRPRKKRYHRHTQHQIQEMEMFFKECPHPDDKQRKELSRELGLEPLQVKFWFQNKRTQMKHFKARELGMLARCLCVPLVSIRVGKVIKQGSLLCPTSTRDRAVPRFRNCSPRFSVSQNSSVYLAEMG